MGERALRSRASATVPLLPGIGVAAALAVVAGWVAGGLGEPLAHNPVLVAMLFGLLVGNSFGCPNSLKAGLDFSKRYLLRLGVILVGFRITVRLLSELGIVPIGIAAIELIVVLLVLNWVAVRWLKLDRELALLVAAGSAICGAAAILCVAALTRAREQSAGIAIALITLTGTLALLIYPVAFASGFMPAFDDRLYGIFVGSSIYELAQVYGASFAVSEGALNTATLVKLSKVLMLVPMLLILSAARRRGSASLKAGPPPFPWFVVGFIAVMLLNSSVTLHPQLRRLILDFDQLLFMMVMIALGLSTNLSRLAEGGACWRLICTGLVGLVLSSCATFALVTSLANTATKAPPASPEGAIFSSVGGRIFSSTGCAKCHVPSLRAHDGASVTLYSDLLLHDMGPALDDKVLQGDATGAEWRTAPLVSLRLRQHYLHDGRATTLRDAILSHGGEGLIVRDRFFNLDEADRQAVYDFLATL
jgi:uncharacterized integral membrane protein (TIGR00698 family)